MTGQHYKSHTSIWITNRIQELHAYLSDILQNTLHITGWVNGNLFLPTSEVLGILPIPEEIRHSCGMAEYLPVSLTQRKKHHFLAQRQGTRKAILPVHTAAEHDFFRKLMTESAVFNPPDGGQPQWTIGVKIWNAYADTQDEISYKVRGSVVYLEYGNLNPV